MELINGFLKVIGGVSILGLGLVYLSRLMAQQVFKKNMADYQGEIAKELEKIKLQQQKNFKDFELFTSKKHEKYPEMYLRLENAFGQIISIPENGIGSFSNFNNYNDEDIELYLNELGLTRFDRERIMGLWRADSDKELAGETTDNISQIRPAVWELHLLERSKNFQRAQECLKEANNYYYNNLLYFSDNVSEACKKLLRNLGELSRDINPESVFSTDEKLKEAKNLLKYSILPENRISVRREMQKELRIE